ncbi:LysR family transcriptional regulator [Caballeronia fortuita]|uniref:LysR family transcriptional regulator n=1 Tax=Caballeronia fortuita TaxID=1777138 RepID=A0A158AU03_9BURK|nr:LysR family transcriptional regulator [Caballeronia fortuita]
MKTSAPEMLTRRLFRDRYVGACRVDHPLLGSASVSVGSWLAFAHVLTARRGDETSPVDVALRERGVRRRVSMVVPSFGNAMQVARRSDLLAAIPHSCVGNMFAPGHAAANGLQWFELPVSTPAFNVSAIWHPRLDHDAAHRWLRAEALALCLTAYPQDSVSGKRSPSP